MKLKMKLYLKIIIALCALAIMGAGISAWSAQRQPNWPKEYSSLGSLEDYYSAAKNLGKKVDTKTEVSFLAVGDIMLGREVSAQMAAAKNDGFLPFRRLDDLLHSTDFNFGNLESPFSGSDTIDADPNSFKFNAPTWAISGLSQFNFKMLSLANNHILNQGTEGLAFTKNLLAENYLQGVGAGQNLDEAWQGQITEVKGVKVGFIAATYAPNSPYLANINNLQRLEIAIADLKARADFVVVSMHAGEEYVREPNEAQTKFAKAAIDSGADLVVGSHPHWVQPFEKYNGKYIFYSLGNFVFDQEWSQDTKQGLAIKVTLSKAGGCTPAPGLNAACGGDVQGSKSTASLKQIELIPVVIENYSTPRLANALEKEALLKKIGATISVITP
jgi:hypothetical protein